MSKSSTTKQGALIFLHGLGDSPSGWSSLARTLPMHKPRLSQLEYVFPAAPTVAISINGGARMPGWFDLYDWPVSVGDKDDAQGLQASVTQLQDEIESLEKAGIPRDKIVIGGFSQGAAVALLAAYHAGAVKRRSDEATETTNALAGVVALSGWVTLANELSVSNAAKKIPCWWAHGSYDDKVLFNQQAFGSNKLKEHGVNVSTVNYPMGHESNPEEIKDLAEFLDNTLFGRETSEL
jgi:lysophospholipase-2